MRNSIFEERDREMCERERKRQRNVRKKVIAKRVRERKRQRNLRKKEVEKFEKERGREM